MEGKHMKRILFSSVTAAALLGAGSTAFAEPVGAVGVEVICPATGPGIAVCAPVGVALHELVKLGNGEDAFGPNGEIMKILGAPVGIVHQNIKGAERESGEIDKVLKGATGISVQDIKNHGVFGGPDSVFRKPFG
ncbi:MAG: hypothetical protein AAFX81_21195 [Pseudomonadota bacterium]